MKNNDTKWKLEEIEVFLPEDNETDENEDDLKNIITSKIRKIPNIRTTLTLTVVESQE